MEPSCVLMLRVGTEEHINIKRGPILLNQSSCEFDLITTLSSIHIRATNDTKNSKQWLSPLASPKHILIYSLSHILVILFLPLFVHLVG